MNMAIICFLLNDFLYSSATWNLVRPLFHDKGNLDYIREKVKANERAKRLEEENKSLKEVLNIGLNKEKQYCFNEDGNTGMCLGYGDDKPCDYCKSCKKLNLKEED